jgi:hypothetical protein
MMRRQTKTLLAFAAVLVMYAGAAQANEHHGAKTAGREGATETAGNEISGRVVQASPSKLFLEHMGAVVEFNIAPDAQFSGGSLRSSRDLSEGQEVRASFTVENKTSNVVKRISAGTEGGSRGKKVEGAAPEPGRATPGLPGHPPGTETAPAPQEPGATPPTK